MNPEYIAALWQLEKLSIMAMQEKKWFVIDDVEMNKGIEIISILKQTAGTSIFTEEKKPIW